jgi:hypothetical protein
MPSAFRPAIRAQDDSARATVVKAVAEALVYADGGHDCAITTR